MDFWIINSGMRLGQDRESRAFIFKTETRPEQIFQNSNILGQNQAQFFWKDKQADEYKTETYQ